MNKWINIIIILTPLEDIAKTRFSKMTSCDLDLWPHDLENLISSSTCHRELPCQVWWRSFNSLGRYRVNKIFQDDLMWPSPLTPRPWKTNQFIYMSKGVTMSSLVKILRFSKMTSCDLDLWTHDLENLISSSTCHKELPCQVWWRSLKSSTE